MKQRGGGVGKWNNSGYRVVGYSTWTEGIVELNVVEKAIAGESTVMRPALELGEVWATVEEVVVKEKVSVGVWLILVGGGGLIFYDVVVSRLGLLLNNVPVYSQKEDLISYR